MKEFDLKSIWDGADQEAKDWYQRLRPEVIAHAKQQNDNVLHKIQRLTIIELISGFAGAIWLLYYIRDSQVWLQVSALIFFFVIMYISFHQYWSFKKKADQVPTLNIIASTQTYLRLINDYEKRLNRIASLLIPICILVGVILGFNVNGERDYSHLLEPKTWWVLLPTIIILSILSILGTKWYYSYFIGSKEKELRQVLDSLEEDLE